MFGKQYLLNHTETMGHRKEFQQTHFAKFLSPPPSSYYIIQLLMVVALLAEQVLCLNSFWQLDPVGISWASLPLVPTLHSHQAAAPTIQVRELLETVSSTRRCSIGVLQMNTAPSLHLGVTLENCTTAPGSPQEHQDHLPTPPSSSHTSTSLQKRVYQDNVYCMASHADILNTVTSNHIVFFILQVSLPSSKVFSIFFILYATEGQVLKKKN